MSDPFSIFQIEITFEPLATARALLSGDHVMWLTQLDVFASSKWRDRLLRGIEIGTEDVDNERETKSQLPPATATTPSPPNPAKSNMRRRQNGCEETFAFTEGVCKEGSETTGVRSDTSGGGAGIVAVVSDSERDVDTKPRSCAFISKRVHNFCRW
jgi:hypothetical protein